MNVALWAVGGCAIIGLRDMQAAYLPHASDDRLWVVIPAFNEATAIEGTIASLRRYYQNVVVIDDASTDGTAELAARAGATVIRHVVNRGQGAALQTGITFAIRANAEIIVTFDADGQHQPTDIPALVAPVKSGECDVVLGSRFRGSSNVPRARRILLSLAVVFTRLMTGAVITDTHNGLRAFSHEAARRLNLTMDRMAHASELIDQIVAARLRFVEVPVHVLYTPYSIRKGQTSTLGALRVLWEYLLGRWFR